MNISPDVYKKIITAKLYIDGNFHECINLDGISGKALISRFHFHRLFTSTDGVGNWFSMTQTKPNIAGSP
jgi:hypothetical protein